MYNFIIACNLIMKRYASIHVNFINFFMYYILHIDTNLTSILQVRVLQNLYKKIECIFTIVFIKILFNHDNFSGSN